MTDWGYTQANGPSEWGKTFPIAVTGTRQSPIDIQPESCNNCPSTSDSDALKITYPTSVSGCTLKNSGYGWVVNLPCSLQTNANITGAAVNNETYILEQFHAHWGNDDSCGSEHTICGKSYSAELHLVHWNKDRFASFAEAAKNEKGLAVIAVFLDSCDDSTCNNNVTLNNVTSQLKQIPFKGDIVDLKMNIQLNDLLPNDHSFWTYDGSLTTPPLYESVTWLVLKEPVKISAKQLHDFRSLHCGPEGSECVHQNFRPPQPIFQRTVHFISSSSSSAASS